MKPDWWTMAGIAGVAAGVAALGLIFYTVAS
jgi:hypothetical protein